MPVEIKFSVDQTIFVRPGQIVEIASGKFKTQVLGVDHNSFRDESSSPTASDLYVILRPGEVYTARRDDGTLLKISAVEL